MKKMLFLVLALTLTYLSKAQEVQRARSFKKKDQWLGISYGFVQRYGSYFDDEIKIDTPYLHQFRTHQSIGPISFYYEKAITEKISVGGQLTIGNVNSEILLTDTSAGKNTKDSFNLKLIYAGVLVNANYHYGHSSKFDPYIGVGIGYGYSKSFVNQIGSYNGYREMTTKLPSPFLLVARAGVNYFINPDLALHLEAGIMPGCYLNAGVIAKW